jgi:hypothetical protein
MEDPDLILSTLVTCAQSIPEYVCEMGANSSNIFSHQFLSGTENSLTRHIEQSHYPSTIFTYRAILSGNYLGSPTFKHVIEVYIKPKNAVSGSVIYPDGSFRPPSSSPKLWKILLDYPMSSAPSDWVAADPSITTSSIFRRALLPSLWPMDLPNAMNQPQGADLFDMWVGTLIFPEAMAAPGY